MADQQRIEEIKIAPLICFNLELSSHQKYLMKVQRDADHEYYKTQIAQLIPQGDDEGLLTFEEWIKFFRIENAVQRKNAEGMYTLEKDRLKAQRDLTRQEHEKECKKCEYDPQAAEIGWFLRQGWIPPEELQQKLDEAKKVERERIIDKIEGKMIEQKVGRPYCKLHFDDLVALKKGE